MQRPESLRFSRFCMGCWESWEAADLPGYFFFNCFKISLAALAPEPPVNPAPGWVPEPQRNKFVMGVEYRAQSSNGRMVKN